jgi:hypothetical protein
VLEGVGSTSIKNIKVSHKMSHPPSPHLPPLHTHVATHGNTEWSAERRLARPLWFPIPERVLVLHGNNIDNSLCPLNLVNADVAQANVEDLPFLGGLDETVCDIRIVKYEVALRVMHQRSRMRNLMCHNHLRQQLGALQGGEGKGLGGDLTLAAAWSDSSRGVAFSLG